LEILQIFLAKTLSFATKLVAKLTAIDKFSNGNNSNHAPTGIVTSVFFFVARLAPPDELIARTHCRIMTMVITRWSAPSPGCVVPMPASAATERSCRWCHACCCCPGWVRHERLWHHWLMSHHHVWVHVLVQLWLWCHHQQLVMMLLLHFVCRHMLSWSHVGGWLAHCCRGMIACCCRCGCWSLLRHCIWSWH